MANTDVAVTSSGFHNSISDGGMKSVTHDAIVDEEQSIRSSDKYADFERPGEGQLRKSFSLWSILGVGFGLTNSWFGISVSMVTGIYSGGPMMVVYGIITVSYTHLDVYKRQLDVLIVYIYI